MSKKGLLKIAKRCYVKGTVFYEADFQSERHTLEIDETTYKQPSDRAIFAHDGAGALYWNGKWAKIELPKPEIGMRVVHGPTYPGSFDRIGTITKFTGEKFEGKHSFYIKWDGNIGNVGNYTLDMKGVIPYLGEDKKSEPQYEVGDIVWTNGDNINHYKEPKLGIVQRVCSNTKSEHRYLVHYLSDCQNLYSDVSRKLDDTEVRKEIKKILKARYPHKAIVRTLYDVEREIDATNFDVDIFSQRNIRGFDNKGFSMLFQIDHSEVKWARIVKDPNCYKEPEMEWIPTYDYHIEGPTHIIRLLMDDNKSLNNFKKGDIVKAYQDFDRDWVFKDKDSRIRYALPSQVEILKKIGEVVTPSSNDKQAKSNKNGNKRSNQSERIIHSVSRREGPSVTGEKSGRFKSVFKENYRGQRERVARCTSTRRR